MKTKIYNAGAWGIPEAIQADVARLAVAGLPLNYTRHSMREALNDRYGVLASRHFPTVFSLGGWTLVEAEAQFPDKVDKFVVRKPVDERRSLVLVVTRDGTVKTLWTNLNTDGHSTLNKERFDKP